MCYFAAKQQTDYCTTMKIEHVKLTQVKINAENPRTISRPKFQKLIDSILAFPAMLEIRPVVVDGTMVALGGNQRLSALREIAKMSTEELAARLYRLPEYQEKGDAERARLVEFWEAWRETPTIQVVNARHLTEHERKQFIIKDNVSYGAWDYDALADKWDAQRLESWGMDVWTGIPIESISSNPMAMLNDNDSGHGGTSSGMVEESDCESVSPDDFGESFSLPDGDRSPYQQMTFSVADEQARLIRECISVVKKMEMPVVDTFGNQNANGNALYLIVKQWEEQRK